MFTYPTVDLERLHLRRALSGRSGHRLHDRRREGSSHGARGSSARSDAERARQHHHGPVMQRVRALESVLASSGQRGKPTHW